MYYEKKIDTRSRALMVKYLSGHYRYNTMSSWNASTSYANCIKVNQLGLNDKQYSKAFDLLDTDFWQEIRDPIDDFTSKMNGSYTIGTNGRSGGYLVLYQSKYELSQYKSWCPSCGQRNCTVVTETSTKCGVCSQPRRDYERPLRQLAVYPGKGIDQREDFSEWTMADLRNRVELVRSFDRACDDIRSAFIWMIDECDVVSEEYSVPRIRKILVPRHAA